jgi:hypothetical protein
MLTVTCRHTCLDADELSDCRWWSNGGGKGLDGYAVLLGEKTLNEEIVADDRRKVREAGPTLLRKTEDASPDEVVRIWCASTSAIMVQNALRYGRQVKAETDGGGWQAGLFELLGEFVHDASRKLDVRVQVDTRKAASRTIT